MDDMLNVGRKAAFVMRKSKSASSGGNNEDEEEEIEESNTSTLLTIDEEWEDWYPQEWIPIFEFQPSIFDHIHRIHV